MRFRGIMQIKPYSPWYSWVTSEPSCMSCPMMVLLDIPNLHVLLPVSINVEKECQSVCFLINTSFSGMRILHHRWISDSQRKFCGLSSLKWINTNHRSFFRILPIKGHKKKFIVVSSSPSKVFGTFLMVNIFLLL